MNKKSLMIAAVLSISFSGIGFKAFANESVSPFLLYYGGGPAITQQMVSTFAEYELVVTDRFRHSQVGGNTWKAIKSLSPDTKIFLYQDGPFVHSNTDSYPLRGLNNLARYNVSRGSSDGSLKGDHPDWFLMSSSGQPVVNIIDPKRLVLDFGNPDFAAYWAKHTIEDIAQQEWAADGVLIDGVSLCSTPLLKKNQKYTPAKYSNCASRNKNMADFLQRVSGSLQAAGQQVMANVGNSFNEGGLEAWKSVSRRSTAPNILAEEGAFAAAFGKSGDVMYWPVKNWQQTVDLPANVSSSVAFISHTDLAPGQAGTSWSGAAANHSQIKRFAVGSYLLARNGPGAAKTYMMFDDNRKTRGSAYNRLVSTEIYDDFDIGVPVQPYNKVPGYTDLYFRKYSNGYVYVNPSSNKIEAIKAERGAKLSGEHLNARQTGSEWIFDLEPHDAAILLSGTGGNAKPEPEGAPPLPPKLQ